VCGAEQARNPLHDLVERRLRWGIQNPLGVERIVDIFSTARNTGTW